MGRLQDTRSACVSERGKVQEPKLAPGQPMVVLGQGSKAALGEQVAVLGFAAGANIGTSSAGGGARRECRSQH